MALFKELGLHKDSNIVFLKNMYAFDYFGANR